MRKIISGDQVKVISGSDAGKVGVVQKVLPSLVKGGGEARVVVADVNVRKFVKKSQAGKKFETKACPISISNVALMSGDGVVLKVGFKLKDGVKRRVFKKTAEFV